MNLVRTFSMKELGDIAGQIPEEKDWRAMDRFDMPELVRKQLIVWAQTGILIVGAGAKATTQAEKIQELIGLLSERDREVSQKDEHLSEKDKEIVELKVKLASTSGKVAGLEYDLKRAEDRVATAENESGLLRSRNGELESELETRRPEADIIAAFKESDEYIDALVGAAVEKLQRCWVVAEKLIKIDADSPFAKFADLYIAAEKEFEESRVEPAPYDGPGPIFPQISRTAEARTEPLNPNDAQHVQSQT